MSNKWETLLRFHPFKSLGKKQTKQTWNWKEGDRIMVEFEDLLFQPAYAKKLGHPGTNPVKAHKPGTITKIFKGTAYVVLDTGHNYRGWSRGWVKMERLIPNIERRY